MLGPFLETAVLSVFGPRGNFLAVSVINVVVTIVMAKTARETRASTHTHTHTHTRARAKQIV
jgi:hypothetical protein